MKKLFSSGLIISATLFALVSSLDAQPITPNGIVGFAFWDNEGENTVGTGTGQSASFGVVFVSPDGDNGTTAYAYNAAKNETIALPSGSSYGTPDQFATDLDYSANNLTQWKITLKNESDELVVYTPDHSDAQKMEFVKKLSITGEATSPTVTWELPTTGAEVSRVSYEIWNDETNSTIQRKTTIPGGAMASSVTLSDLTPGVKYAIRIMPENRDEEGTTARSSNWLGWLAQNGSAEGTVLELVAGSPAGVTQNVDTPTTTFTVEFDYQFKTVTGLLNVSLDGKTIGTTYTAPTEATEIFSHAVIEVEDSSLLGLTSVPLLLQIDGPAGSKIVIDNISFPSLENGNFEQGLTMWVTSGAGSVTTLHAPPTLLTQTQVSQLYVSIFGRASEGDGNAYWQSEQSDMTVAANTMLNTEPAKAYFGDTLNDNQMFIEFIYENTLGKTYADDPEGVNYWVSELAGGKSKGQVVATLINAAIDPQYSGLAAQDQFLNKVAVSNYTAETIATVPDVNDMSAFVAFISDVTDDPATVVVAKAAVDAF